MEEIVKTAPIALSLPAWVLYAILRLRLRKEFAA